jgi:small-conductance mechanosensitive channel
MLLAKGDSDPVSTFVDLVRIGGVVTALGVLVGTWFVAQIVTGSLNRLGQRFHDKRLALNQINTLARFVIYIGGIFLSIALSFNLSKEVLLAITGTAAVTVGFALKDFAASILAGIIIIIDRPFQVGDRIQASGYYGEVTSIGLRSVRLATLDDNVVTIPNNKFLTDVVASGNWGALDMLIQVDFLIGVDQDVSLAKQLVSEAITSCRYAYAKKPWTVLVSQVLRENHMAIQIRSKAYILDLKYEKAYETELTERVLDAFRNHAIQPPAILHRNLANVGVPTGSGKSRTTSPEVAA